MLPPRTPVLVDLARTADDPDVGPGAGLAFGAGPHVCAGVHLARAELAAAIGGSRLAALPAEGLRR